MRRYYTDPASDPVRNRIVLFGGADNNGAHLGDTWEWNGVDWLLRTPANSPPPRHGHAMAYDPLRNRMVLFGGIISDPAHTYRDDTWEWDGVNWQEVSPTIRPAPRRLHAMTWDGVNQQVLLFSGKIGFANWSDDTWHWNGSTWTRLLPASSPPARDGHRMVYDSNRQRVVLFGGWVGSGTSDDTWEWSGSQWLPMNPAQRPAPRTNHGLCFDPIRARTVLAGGSPNDTWQWDGTTWLQIAQTTPFPPLAGWLGMAFDHSQGNPVATFQGPFQPGVPNETWKLDYTATSSATSYGIGCAGSNGISTATAVNHPALGTTFQIAGTNLPTYGSQLAIGFFGFSGTTWGFNTLPYSLAPYGLPGCSLWASPPPPGVIESTFTQNGTCMWSYPVPTHPVFLGVHLYFQALIPDPQAGNPLGATVTNGIDLLLGT